MAKATKKQALGRGLSSILNKLDDAIAINKSEKRVIITILNFEK